MPFAGSVNHVPYSHRVAAIEYALNNHLIERRSKIARNNVFDCHTLLYARSEAKTVSLEPSLIQSSMLARAITATAVFSKAMSEVPAKMLNAVGF